MSIIINQLFQWHDDTADQKWVERVLFMNQEVGEFAVINIDDANARPFFRSFKELNHALEERIVLPLESDFYAPRRLTESDLAYPRFKTFRERRDKAFKIIAPLFEGEKAVQMLFEKSRAALIKARAEEIRIWPKEERASVRTIYLYCRRWWQGGQTPNALFPRYDNCGARENKPRSVNKKLGRKSLLTASTGLITGANMRDDWLKAIRLGGKLFYERRKNPSYKKAYTQTLARFFIKDKIVENGREKIILPDPNFGEIFTLGQFRYHYSRNRDIKQSLFNRTGAKRYNLKHEC